MVKTMNLNLLQSLRNLTKSKINQIILGVITTLSILLLTIFPSHTKIANSNQQLELCYQGHIKEQPCEFIARKPSLKEKILAETKHQFLERGPGVTTKSSVLEATGITEQEFDKHFVSMEEVTWEVIQDYTKAEFDFIQNFIDKADEQTNNPTDKALTFFKLFYEDFLAEWYKTAQVPPPGDLFSVFVYNREAVSPELYEHSVDSLKKWVGMYENVINPMLEKPQPLEEINSQELAKMMVSINLGAIILGRATDDPFLLSRQERLFSDYLHRITQQQ